MLTGDFKEISLLNLEGVVEALADFLASPLGQAFLCMLVWGGFCSLLYWLFCHPSLRFRRSPELHEIDPETLNFRLSQPYKRTSYKQPQQLYRTSFVNSQRFGGITVCQGRYIYSEDTVDIFLTDGELIFDALRFSLPGDPRSPVNLEEVVNQIFESQPSKNSCTDSDHRELRLIRESRHSFLLEFIRRCTRC